MTEAPPRSPVVCLAGGVGGAKLAEGLQAAVGEGLTVVVNTADDTERHGLLVCPDHDTVMYTLAGLENSELGWGIAGDTWAAMGALERYGEEGWFRLGDQDLATHVVRTRLLRDGLSLTEACRRLQARLGLRATILPMADEPVRTQVRTNDGWLDFQDYFVRLRQAPEVREVRFAGIDVARPTTDVIAALDAAQTIVIAPSNPIVSIGPILALPELRDGIPAARERGVDRVENEHVDQAGVDAGHAQRGRLVAEGREHPVRRSLERLAADDPAHGDDHGAALAGGGDPVPELG